MVELEGKIVRHEQPHDTAVQRRMHGPRQVFRAMLHRRVTLVLLERLFGVEGSVALVAVEYHDVSREVAPVLSERPLGRKSTIALKTFGRHIFRLASRKGRFHLCKSFLLIKQLSNWNPGRVFLSIMAPGALVALPNQFSYMATSGCRRNCPVKFTGSKTLCRRGLNSLSSALLPWVRPRPM